MPQMVKALELLSNIDVFSNLDKRQLESLADIAQSRQYAAGKIVFRQGDKSETFHVVVSGQLECFLWDDLLKIERPLSTFKKGDIFGEMGLLTDESRSAFVRAQEESETLVFDKQSFLDLLEKNPKVLLNFARILAHRLVAANKAAGIKFEQLATFKVGKELVRLLPLQVILRNRVLPVAKGPHEVTVAIVDPTDQLARNTALQFLPRQKISWVCISHADFENFRDKILFDLVSDRITDVPELTEEITYPSSKTGATLEATSSAAKTIDELLSGAINAGASDLHFEPGPNHVNVRARIDGRLVEMSPALNFAVYKPIVSRIKVLADMDITETRLPQDSVLRVRYGSRNVDLRISTVPAPHGESVACRLFDPARRKLDIDHLIASEGLAEVVKKLFYLPSGLLLVTGPTGSGKTTTLYAGLQLRGAHAPTQKIVTAEDPIEYELNGATQVQVNPNVGLTYERILRSLLRQDPDVILVGEIRDRESMEIALEAALTGHFVLSSLHTNDVFETVMRIRQRGVEPYVIASSLRGVISQRLVPRLCSVCAQEISIPDETLDELRKSGIVSTEEKPKGWEAKGCSHCRMTGYKGRVALYEVLVVTPPFRRAIEEGLAISDLEQVVAPGSFVSMRRYAKFVLEKGLAAASDLLEVLPAAALIGRV